MNEFINEPNGTLGNLSKRLNQLAKMFADNPSAIAQIKEGRKALAAKRKEAQSKTF